MQIVCQIAEHKTTNQTLIKDYDNSSRTLRVVIWGVYTAGMANGKGDKQRPRLVKRTQFEANWDKTFRKKPLSVPFKDVAKMSKTEQEALLDVLAGYENPK